MENYSHFIITRFNLNLYAQDKHDLPTRTDRWLEHRFEVFERGSADEREFHLALSFRCRDARVLPPPYRRL